MEVPSERKALEERTQGRTTPQALAPRARILLARAEGCDNSEVAEEPSLRTKRGVALATFRPAVRRVLEEPRPVLSRISDAQFQRLIVKALESRPRSREQ